MKKNRFLVFLLALIMMMSAVVPGLAEGEKPKEYERGYFTYILLDDGTAEIVDYDIDDKSSEVKIPDQLNGYTVSSIAGNPFSSNFRIIRFDVTPGNPYFAVIDGVLFSKVDKRLVAYPRGASESTYSIPQGICIIGDEAFYDCDSLQSVTIPDSVTSIGDSAFYYCSSLQSVTIPDSVTSIGDGAFRYCKSLQSITIPDSVASIGDCAFCDCDSLQSITIPDSVTSIGDNAFSGCKSLQSITIPDSVTSIGDNAFSGCKSLQSVTIPDGVSSIGANPFSGRDNLSEIIVSPNHPCLEMRDGLLIYKSDEEIRLVNYPRTFTATEFTVPEGITSIGDRAFCGCDSLQSITIPDSVTSIGDGAFCFCDSLQSVSIPASVTSIGDEAFQYCESLQSVTIPDSVTSIGEEAFYKCPKSLTLTVTQGSYAETYAIENDLTYIYPNSNDWLLD